MNFGGEGGCTSSSAEPAEDADDGCLSRQSQSSPGGTKDAMAVEGRWRAARDGSPSTEVHGDGQQIEPAEARWRSGREGGRRWLWVGADVLMSGRLAGGGHERGRCGWSSVGDVEGSRSTASVFGATALG
jgi:hypothetical protein